MTELERQTVVELAEAALPFISGDTVDETGGTIPLMERLENALRRVRDIGITVYEEDEHQ